MTPLFDTITLSMIKRLTFSLLLTCLYVPCFPRNASLSGAVFSMRNPLRFLIVRSAFSNRATPRSSEAPFPTRKAVTACISSRRAAICSATTICLRILLPNGRGSGGANPARCDSTSGQPTYRRGGRGGPKYRIQGRPLRSQYVG